MSIVVQPRSFQKAFAFAVEIEGFKSHGFREVRGLSWHSQNLYPPPGVLRLERGKVVGDTDLMDWFNERPSARRRIVVKLLNREGFVQQRIGLEVHEFKSYNLSPLDNNSDENVQESVTFSYHSIEELPLTQKDRDALFSTVKGRAEHRARETDEEVNKARAVWEAARKASVESAQLTKQAESEAFRALNEALHVRDCVFARAQDEIAAVREKYAPAAPTSAA